MFEDALLLWAILLTIAATIIHMTVTTIRDKKKAEQAAHESFGKIPVRKDAVATHVKDYHTYITEAQPHPDVVDAITWNDLNMDEVFMRINTCASTVGEETLYHLLHRLEIESETLEHRGELIRWMQEDEPARTELQRILLGIGRRNDQSLSFYLFHAATKRLGSSTQYIVQGLLPAVSLLLALFFPGIGLAAFLFTALANIITFQTTRSRLDAEMDTMLYLSALLYGAKSIDRKFGEPLRALRWNLSEPLRPFQRAGGRIPGRAQSVTAELDALSILPRAIFLWDLMRYNYMVGLLIRHQEEIHRLFVMVGEIDAAIAVASFRKSLPQWCLPEFHDINAVQFHALIHPLLEKPVANSGRISNDTIITGSNASGKSTFIKTLAVNHILAQTILTCTAQRYQMSPAYVCSSMAVKDDILAGESYFIAEIRSLKRIMQYSRERRCLCLIDEILRGTNTPERIAASTAVLKALHETDSLCLIATHDLELTEILNESYDSYHFSETFEDGEITFDYTLKNGPSTSTNAIKLLEYMGFPKEIVVEASELVR